MRKVPADLLGTPALSSWWLTHLRRIASGDIFMRDSSCSPPSSRLARPGHCSREIWLNRPEGGGGHWGYWSLEDNFIWQILSIGVIIEDISSHLSLGPVTLG